MGVPRANRFFKLADLRSEGDAFFFFSNAFFERASNDLRRVSDGRGIYTTLHNPADDHSTSSRSLRRLPTWVVVYPRYLYLRDSKMSVVRTIVPFGVVAMIVEICSLARSFLVIVASNVKT